MRSYYTAVLALTLCLGCGGEAANPLVGSWRQPSGNRWDFQSDSTYRETKFVTHAHGNTGQLQMHEITSMGSYQVRGQVLYLKTITATGSTRSLSQSFYVDEHRLLFGVLLSEGFLQGIVGSWVGRQTDAELAGEQVVQSFDTVRRLILREDGSASETVSPPEPALETTYRYEQWDVPAYKLIDGEGREERITQINGGVLDRFGAASTFLREP